MSGRPFKRAAVALCFAALFAAARSAGALEPPRERLRETAADRVWSWMLSEISAAWKAVTAFAEEPADPTATTNPDPGDNEGWLVDPNG